MATKRAVLYFNSDSNQLPYSGSPATYCDWEDVISISVDDSFDHDGVPVSINSFYFNWKSVSNRFSPVYVRYRARDDQYGTQSNWSIPKTVYTAVRYAVYKRRVADTPQPWVLVEVVKQSNAGPYQENWAGRVQYAIGLWHVDGKPAASEGVVSETDFSNRYILFATDPTSATMNTNQFVM